MYGYSNPGAYLSIDYILQHVDQVKVFEVILDHKVEIGEFYTSPFRLADTSAGAFYTWYKGTLKFCDFADTKKTSRSCIDAVSEVFNLSLPQALNYINEHFIKNNPSSAPPPSPLEVRERHPILMCFRHYNEKDRAYWFDNYGITRAQLAEDEVLPLNWYKFYSNRQQQWCTLAPRDIAFAITGWDSMDGVGKDDIAKIYRPNSPKGEGKWLTNCSSNHIGNIKRLQKKGDRLIITKSYKDHRLLKNSGFQNTIWIQNEGMLPPDDRLLELSQRFKEITIIYDNDETGIRASQKLKYQINSLQPSIVRCASIPQRLLTQGIKDPSDLYKFSQEQYREFLNSIENQY